MAKPKNESNRKTIPTEVREETYEDSDDSYYAVFANIPETDKQMNERLRYEDARAKLVEEIERKEFERKEFERLQAKYSGSKQ